MTERRTGRWLVEFRKRHFAAHPLCERCSQQGRIRLASELDHRIALDNGGKDFPEDPANAQGLCGTCHVDKTAEDMRHRKPVRIGVDGFPVGGGGSR